MQLFSLNSCFMLRNEDTSLKSYLNIPLHALLHIKLAKLCFFVLPVNFVVEKVGFTGLWCMQPLPFQS